VTRDGEVRDILLSAISELDDAGNFIRSLAVLTDVTERKRADEALRESEERFRAIIEATPVPLVISRREDGTMLYANPKVATTLGLPADQVVGRSMAEFYFDPSRREALIGRLGRDGFVRDFELELTREDGGNISTIHSLQAISYKGEPAILGAFYDITERKQAEAALLEANEGLARQRRELEQLTRDLMAARDQADFANRTKSEFLANMSHELRTPLNAVIGFSTITGDAMFGPVGNPKYVEYANDINDSGKHLLELINDILDLSKIEAGKLELHEQDVDVARAVEACLTVVKERAQEANLRLDTDFAEGLPPLWADLLKLKQILINLLSNAVKFTPSGGAVGVRAFVEPGGGFTIEVSDTGVGIAAADIDEVMKPFTQVDGGLARRHQGTGLGLPMVKGLVEVHEGTIEIESEVGVGTTARVRFPPARVHERAA
jgi:PAS domain S-box-containing protein